MALKRQLITGEQNPPRLYSSNLDAVFFAMTNIAQNDNQIQKLNLQLTEPKGPLRGPNF